MRSVKYLELDEAVVKKEDGKEHVDIIVELDSYSYSTLPKY